MPVYNAAPYLRTALDSLLAQTYQHWTLLCVDDGSTDGSGAIVSDYCCKDARITSLWQPHSGLSAALNHGILRTDGTWIARMDADDWAHPERLARQMAFLTRNPGTAILGTQGFAFTETHAMTTTGDWGDPLPWQPCLESEIRRQAEYRNPFIHSSVIFHRDVVQQVGGYDESFRYCPDFALWNRIATTMLGWGLANLPQRLIGYRRHHRACLTARYPIRKWWENARVVCA